MNWWEAVVLGLVQGLTEFLPVSSSGHLVLTEAVLGVEAPGVLVEVVLHVGTLLAVILVYAVRLRELIAGAAIGRRPALRTIGLLLVATVPAVVVGFTLKDFFESTFQSIRIVGIDLMLTGLILWSTRRAPPARTREPGVGGAVGIGLAQALAILPGISRSGTTVTTGLWLGLDPVRAAEFSFLMALPAIAGAAVLQIPDLAQGAQTVGWGALTVGFVAALASGVFAIRGLIWLLRRGGFWRFAPYCWGLGATVLLWTFLA